MACASALQGLSCAEVQSETDPTACQPPAGTVAMGQPCGFNAQCTTQFCLVALGAICGTCQAEPQAGSACSENGCGQGLGCVNSTGLCQTQVTTVGGSCSTTAPCGPGLACVTVHAGTTQCESLGTTVGAACTDKNMVNPDCDRRLGLTCDTATHQCVQDTYASTSETCGATDGGYIACEGGGACSTSSGTSTCEAPSSDNSPCDPSGAAPCLAPAVCVMMTGSSVGTCELQNGNDCH
jgi:hypothetical protein